MASKRRLDTDTADVLVPEEEQGKKLKSDCKNEDTETLSPQPAQPAAASTDSSVFDAKVVEVTNETIRLEWKSLAAGQKFSVEVKSNSFSKSEEIKSIADKSCSIEFSELPPFTKFNITLSPLEDGKAKASTFLETMTLPSLEMPEIEEVQEGCAHLTLAPLPENEAKNLEAYLLLVRPLEDAKDYPDHKIKDSSLVAKLEAIVQPPFYLAYEFTQDDLMEETGGQVKIGSGTENRNGKYGTLQDPKLTSGGYYRTAFVAIMSVDGEQKLFSEESCQMLVK